MRRRRPSLEEIERLLKETDQRINQLVCPKCRVGILERHVTLPEWKKCVVCGFCKEIKHGSTYRLL